MKDKTYSSFVRVVQWIVVAFGLVTTAVGGWIWWSGGRQDAGGGLAGVFIFGGLSIAILAMPKPPLVEGLIWIGKW